MLKKLFLLIAVISTFATSKAQDYQITFAILGNSISPDSVNVLNTNSSGKLTLNGTDVLHLTDTSTGTGINSLEQTRLKVYPNPVQETALVEFASPVSGKASVQITDIKGSVIATSTKQVAAGNNTIKLSGLSKGTYLVNIITPQSKATSVIISQIQGKQSPTIDWQNETSTNITFKSAYTEPKTVDMHYNNGDVLNLTAYLNTLNAEQELVPTESQTLTFDFTVPVAAFAADKTTIAVDSSVVFTNNSTDATEYNWTFEGATPQTATTENPTVNYPTAGTFDVTLQAINSLTADTLTKTDYITVGELPLVGFAANKTTVYADSLVSFTDTTKNNPTSWAWHFGDGAASTSSEQNPSYTYTNAGTYSVTLEATNAFGTKQISKENYLEVLENTPQGEKPITKFAANKTVVAVDSIITFSDSSTNTPTAWLWNFGDGTTSTQQNPARSYATAGTYSVKLMATNAFGSDTLTKTDYITIGELPVVAFKADTIVAVGSTVTFTDTSLNNPTLWRWNFGDTDFSNLQNPTHTYSEAGTYTVSLSVVNAFGKNQTTKTNYIQVGLAPVSGFTTSETIEVADSVIAFTDNTQNTPTNWLWNFGDGTTSTLQNPRHAYTSEGIYTVTLITKNKFGTDTLIKNNFIDVGLAPVTAFSTANTNVVVDSVLTFNNASTNNPSSYSWDFGDGSTSTTENPSHTYTSEGTYTVKLSTSNKYGTHVLSKSAYITAGFLPVAKYSLSKANVAVDSVVQFTDQSEDAVGWSWHFGDGNTASSQNPSHTYTTTGTFTTKLVVTNAFGTDSLIKTDIITVGELPQTAFAASKTTQAVDSTITFTDATTNSPTAWAWDFGDGQTATTQNPEHIYTSAGTYTVKLTATNNFGHKVLLKTDYITVGELPVTDFNANNTTINRMQSILFADASTNSPTTWAWNFGDGNTSTEQNPSNTFTTAGTYTVTLTTSNTFGSKKTVKSNYITVTNYYYFADLYTAEQPNNTEFVITADQTLNVTGAQLAIMKRNLVDRNGTLNVSAGVKINFVGAGKTYDAQATADFETIFDKFIIANASVELDGLKEANGDFKKPSTMTALNVTFDGPLRLSTLSYLVNQSVDINSIDLYNGETDPYVSPRHAGAVGIKASSINCEGKALNTQGIDALGTLIDGDATAINLTNVTTEDGTTLYIDAESTTADKQHITLNEFNFPANSIGPNNIIDNPGSTVSGDDEMSLMNIVTVLNNNINISTIPSGMKMDADVIWKENKADCFNQSDAGNLYDGVELALGIDMSETNNGNNLGTQTIVNTNSDPENDLFLVNVNAAETLFSGFTPAKNGNTGFAHTCWVGTGTYNRSTAPAANHIMVGNNVFTKDVVMGVNFIIHQAAGANNYVINQHPSNVFTVGGIGVIDGSEANLANLVSLNLVAYDGHGNPFYNKDGTGVYKVGFPSLKHREGISSTTPATGVIP